MWKERKRKGSAASKALSGSSGQIHLEYFFSIPKHFLTSNAPSWQIQQDSSQASLRQHSTAGCSPTPKGGWHRRWGPNPRPKSCSRSWRRPKPTGTRAASSAPCVASDPFGAPPVPEAHTKIPARSVLLPVPLSRQWTVACDKNMDGGVRREGDRRDRGGKHLAPADASPERCRTHPLPSQKRKFIIGWKSATLPPGS